MDDERPDTPATTRTPPVALRRAVVIVSAVLLIAALGATIWVLTPYRAKPVALAALESDETVSVVADAQDISFTPTRSRPDTGLILYPGGRVEPEAYAPLARRIAEEGHLVVIVRMPLNLAVLGIERADAVLEANTDIRTWAIGGHSLGGAMAAEYAARNPGAVDGVLLLGAYPGENTDLSAAGLSVLTVHATEDGLVSSSDLRNARGRLPAGSRTVSVLGGNHAGFGVYGPQRGDGDAVLADGVQTEFVARYAAELLGVLTGR